MVSRITRQESLQGIVNAFAEAIENDKFFLLPSGRKAG